MESSRSYNAEQPMRMLASGNALLLPVLSRFGIALGFGDATVDTVCKAHHVHTETFLAVANLTAGLPYHSKDVDTEQLIKYLRGAHHFFIDYRLPSLRSQLLEAVAAGFNTEITLAVLSFFDEFAREVSRHMRNEEESMFTALLKSDPSLAPDRAMGDIKASQRHIDHKLTELKDLIICHFTPPAERVNQLNAVLYQLMACERDLKIHCHLEDCLLVPLITGIPHLETGCARCAMAENSPAHPLDINGDVMLTPRECDIIRAIARGMSNKEIASQLFLSVHTVTTHRRNICAKLNIHSASGLTVFAIMHGLIPLAQAQQREACE